MATALIRPASEADLASILDIYNDAILNTTAVYDYAPHTLAMRQSWLAAKQQAALPVIVAELQGQVAGFGALGAFRAWQAYQYTVENSLYVAANHRGQGLGKQLLAHLIAAAEQMQFHAMVAGIDADNTISLKLHEQFGFQEVAHFHQVGYKFNRWLDLKFMQRLLSGI
ncbi:MAG: N-acetyltransferase family protein [Cyanobacteria bacterium P01_D01_bin.71]